MQVKVQLKHLRISPRKVRLVADLVRGLDVSTAQEQLMNLEKKSCKPILKLLNSALANAEHNFELQTDNLYIEKIFVEDGPTLKRWMPRAHGRATTIRKRTSHIYLILGEKIPSEKQIKEKKSVKTSATVNKDQIKGDVKKKNVEKKNLEPTDKDTIDEKGEEIFDVRSKGKHRHQQNQDKKNMKDKGFLKKVFRRKSGQ